MAERGPCEPINPEDILQSIRDGNNTSTKIASAMGYNKCTIMKKLLKLYRAGRVVRVESIGKTYIYAVKED